MQTDGIYINHPKCRVLKAHISLAFLQIEVMECLLSFGAESFVFQFAIQIFKNQDI
jgi:hypothetical protein